MKIYFSLTLFSFILFFLVGCISFFGLLFFLFYREKKETKEEITSRLISFSFREFSGERNPCDGNPSHASCFLSLEGGNKREVVWPDVDGRTLAREPLPTGNDRQLLSLMVSVAGQVTCCACRRRKRSCQRNEPNVRLICFSGYISSWKVSGRLSPATDAMERRPVTPSHEGLGTANVGSLFDPDIAGPKHSCIDFLFLLREIDEPQPMERVKEPRFQKEKQNVLGSFSLSSRAVVTDGPKNRFPSLRRTYFGIDSCSRPISAVCRRQGKVFHPATDIIHKLVEEPFPRRL